MEKVKKFFIISSATVNAVILVLFILEKIMTYGINIKKEDEDDSEDYFKFDDDLDPGRRNYINLRKGGSKEA